MNTLEEGSMLEGRPSYSNKNYKTSESKSPDRLNAVWRDPAAASQASARAVEMILRINMQDKEPQAIIVFEGDKADDLVNRFCQQNKIKDSNKFQKLKKTIESQIFDHRSRSNY